MWKKHCTQIGYLLSNPYLIIWFFQFWNYSALTVRIREGGAPSLKGRRDYIGQDTLMTNVDPTQKVHCFYKICNTYDLETNNTYSTVLQMTQAK